MVLFSVRSAIFLVVVVVFVVGSDFFCSSKASKKRLVGALSSGVVRKLSSMSVCSWVVHGSGVRGSGVGVFLHRCLRFEVVGWGMLGSPTRLLERSSSLESLSSGSVNHPRRWAVFRLGSCV